jgi:nucleotidyltransferase/DNA polymerase involved in DNA repair
MSYQELLFFSYKNQTNLKAMNTQPELNIDGFFDNIITSYETRIQKIQTAFQSSENITESSHFLFDNVQSSLTDLRKERDLLNAKLCETLAKNGSLRKKDYNTMMSGILCALDEKEKEAETQFLSFIEAQKETAQALKTSLLGIKDITSPDVTEKINLVKVQLSRIAELQETRKLTVLKSFSDFQKLHNRMIESLNNLLSKGDQIHINDIKKIKDQLIKELN